MIYVVVVTAALLAAYLAYTYGLSQRAKRDTEDALARVVHLSNAKRATARANTSAAAEALRIHHATQIRSLDEEQRKQAEQLSNDPAALSKYLIDIGTRH